MNQTFSAALKLHHYLVKHHWRDQALVGPDPGIRINYRIGRFIKSYLASISWQDNLYYLQGQGYWVLANWALHRRTGEARYRQIAIDCSRQMLVQQREDGAWTYPNPEWKGRIATAEGTWASLGLLETYRGTNDAHYLEGVLRWHEFLIHQIGFQQVNDELAVNYFAHYGNYRVPNNSITVLRFLAELAAATRDVSYMQPCMGLLAFIQHVQKQTGEFPYYVDSRNNGRHCRPHFQCYQYNAFECLNLIRYYELTDDEAVLPAIARLLNFLSGGLGKDGHAFYDCGNQYRAVTYHAAALGAAFAKGSQLDLGNYENLARRAYRYVLSMQRSDGGFIYSRRDYRLLTDRRSYPRYLAMILLHLLYPESPCAS